MNSTFAFWLACGVGPGAILTFSQSHLKSFWTFTRGRKEPLPFRGASFTFIFIMTTLLWPISLLLLLTPENEGNKPK